MAYMPQLDGLRAIAVSAVLVHHLLDPALLPHPAASQTLGFLGVWLFFVLSGFLITGILVRERAAHDGAGVPRFPALRRFYLRRTLRIFPLYYFVLVLALFFAPIAAREQLPWLATYTYNLYVCALGWWPDYFSHFWSLSVEEQFYLVWPWVILFAPRRSLVPAAFIMIAVGPLTRLASVAAQFNSVSVFAFTLSNLDALGAGSLLALVCGGLVPSSGVVRWLRRWALPGGVAVLAVIKLLYSSAGFTVPDHVLYGSATACVFAWVVAGASHGFTGIAGRFLQLRPLVWLGRISYGIYVYHLFMPYLLRPLLAYAGVDLRPFGAGEFALSCVATLAVAWLSWIALERPIIKLKYRFAARDEAVLCRAPNA
jgi:peptidoglycan/LPS O-acetylase OafA/YrhL